jgi:streptomycin 3"-adenylyltransferase
VIPAEIRPQVDEVMAGLTAILDDNLVGIYLHGSAALGCFGPRSDIDLVGVLRRALSDERRRGLIENLLEISVPYESAGTLRPVELDLVLASALDPWRYPTPFEFHFSEEFRGRFEAGELEAWEGLESRTFAANVTVLRSAGVVLGGSPIDDLFPDVPEADYVDALTRDLVSSRETFPQRPNYGVLSIARIWATVATGEPHSKSSGADWTLPRLPAELRPVLEHGRGLHVGAEDDERWQSLPVAAYVTAVADEIERLTPPR